MHFMLFKVGSCGNKATQIKGQIAFSQQITMTQWLCEQEHSIDTIVIWKLLVQFWTCFMKRTKAHNAIFVRECSLRFIHKVI